MKQLALNLSPSRRKKSPWSCSRWIKCVLLCLFTTVVQIAQGELAQVKETITVVNIANLTSQPLRAPARFWKSEQDNTISDLPMEKFQPLNKKQLNKGITRNIYWIHVRLSNSGNESPQSWVLHHETSYLDEISIHYKNNDSLMQKRILSDRRPFSTRQLDYRNLAFSHTTPADSFTDIYLKLRFIEADAMSLNFYLSRADIFYNQTRQ